MLRNIGQLFPLLFRERIGSIRQIGGKCFRIGGVWAPRQSPGNFALSCQFPVSDCCSQTRQSRPSSPRPRNTRQPLHAHHWSCPPTCWWRSLGGCSTNLHLNLRQTWQKADGCHLQHHGRLSVGGDVFSASAWLPGWLSCTGQSCLAVQTWAWKALIGGGGNIPAMSHHSITKTHSYNSVTGIFLNPDSWLTWR